jgi:hypothetical protein
VGKYRRGPSFGLRSPEILSHTIARTHNLFPFSGRLARGQSICWRCALNALHFYVTSNGTHCFVAGLVVGELVQPAAGNERPHDRRKGGSVANAMVPVNQSGCTSKLRSCLPRASKRLQVRHWFGITGATNNPPIFSTSSKSPSLCSFRGYSICPGVLKPTEHKFHSRRTGNGYLGFWGLSWARCLFQTLGELLFRISRRLDRPVTERYFFLRRTVTVFSAQRDCDSDSDICDT